MPPAGCASPPSAGISATWATTRPSARRWSPACTAHRTRARPRNAWRRRGRSTSWTRTGSAPVGRSTSGREAGCDRCIGSAPSPSGGWLHRLPLRRVPLPRVAEAIPRIGRMQVPGASPASPAADRRGAVVAFEQVTKRYAGVAEPAVRDLTFTVPAGEICVLVGPSGSGKTATMKMVNRLIEPTSGRITIDGTDIMRLPVVDLRRRIGYVIQQVGLFPHLTVAENVAVVPRLLRWREPRIRERTEELLELVGLEPGQYRSRYPSELSGGERQRVGVARAMAADPSVMLMDEPFGAVDPIRRERLQNEFLRLQARLRKTIIFVTHDVDEAIKMADRIAILQRGGVLAQYDSPDAILASPASEFVERFVGADRGLKRLSLGRVRDLQLEQPVIARAGEE